MLTSSYNNQLILNEMLLRKIRVSRDKLIFVQKKHGRFIFLEEGNARSGLIHIRERHGEEFYGYGIGTAEIGENLRIAVFNEPMLSLTGGRTRLYALNNIVAIWISTGENGYIVTAWPISRREAQRLVHEETYRFECKMKQPRSAMCSGISEG